MGENSGSNGRGNPSPQFSENGITLNERKLRMSQIQGLKGEAVFIYCEPLITQEMGYHRLSRRVNKMGFKIDIYKSYIRELINCS
jgi:hypothetical protein